MDFFFFYQCFEGSKSSFPPLFSLHFHIHCAHSVGNHRFCQSGENCFPGLGARGGGSSETTGVLQQRAFKQTLLLHTNLKYDYERMVKLQDLLIHWTNINRNQMLGIQNNLHIPYRRRHFLPLQVQELKSKRIKTSAYQVTKEWRAGTVQSIYFEVNILWSSLLLEKSVHFKSHCPSDGALEFDCRILWKALFGM